MSAASDIFRAVLAREGSAALDENLTCRGFQLRAMLDAAADFHLRRTRAREALKDGSPRLARYWGELARNSWKLLQSLMVPTESGVAA